MIVSKDSYLKSLKKLLVVGVLGLVVGSASFIALDYFEFYGIDEDRKVEKVTKFKNDTFDKLKKFPSIYADLPCYSFSFDSSKLCFDRSKFFNLGVGKNKVSGLDTNLQFFYISEIVDKEKKEFDSIELKYGSGSIYVTVSTSRLPKKLGKVVNNQWTSLGIKKNNIEDFSRFVQGNEKEIFEYTDMKKYVSSERPTQYWVYIRDHWPVTRLKRRFGGQYLYALTVSHQVKGKPWSFQFTIFSNDYERFNLAPEKKALKLALEIEQFLLDSLQSKKGSEPFCMDKLIYN